MPKFGAHMSIAGGMDQAVVAIRQIGGEFLQVFIRNRRQPAPCHRQLPHQSVLGLLADLTER